MIHIDEDHLLFIEPVYPARPVVIDHLTRRMTAALRGAADDPLGRRYRGFHGCVCGMSSTNRDYYVEIDGHRMKTNSLAIHYLACHRDEIPGIEMNKVYGLPWDEADPTPTELYHVPIHLR